MENPETLASLSTQDKFGTVGDEKHRTDTSDWHT